MGLMQIGKAVVKRAKIVAGVASDVAEAVGKVADPPMAGAINVAEDVATGVGKGIKAAHNSKPATFARDLVYDSTVQTAEEAAFNSSLVHSMDEYKRAFKRENRIKNKISKTSDPDKIKKLEGKLEGVLDDKQNAIEELENLRKAENKPDINGTKEEIKARKAAMKEAQKEDVILENGKINKKAFAGGTLNAKQRHGMERADIDLAFKEDGVMLPFRLTKGAAIASGVGLAAVPIAMNATDDGIQRHNARKLGRISYSAGMARMTNNAANTHVMDEISQISQGNYEVYKDLASSVFDSQRSAFEKVEDYGANAELIAALYGMEGGY